EINPEIQPEQGWNLEAGVRRRVINGLSAELVLFRMDVRNLIVPRRTALDAFVGRNAGRTLHQGLEAYLRYEKELSQAWRLDGFLSYTMAQYKFIDFVDEELEADYSGNILPGVPAQHLNAGLDIFHKSGAYLNSSFQAVGDMFLRDDNSVTAPGYTLLNARGGWRKVIWQNRLELDLYLGVNNVLDTKYASMLLINAASFGGRAPRYFYPGLPRYLYGGVHLNWNLK
ncbi:MAG: TonB-dependent receptor, partial [Bacteroidota bacterium]